MVVAESAGVVAVPEGNAHDEQIPLSIVSELAVPLETVQLSVAVCPAVMVVGDAVRLNEIGTVTVTV